MAGLIREDFDSEELSVAHLIARPVEDMDFLSEEDKNAYQLATAICHVHADNSANLRGRKEINII